ncbi:hypothetical protein PO124_16980 [Bacillus licheniformis]|nr:hypothetical protein [Bacillus licheniformis]
MMSIPFFMDKKRNTVLADEHSLGNCIGFSLPFSNSASLRANGIVVAGPLEVMMFPSTTTFHLQ